MDFVMPPPSLEMERSYFMINIFIDVDTTFLAYLLNDGIGLKWR
jgi:hypothetical protein